MSPPLIAGAACTGAAAASVATSWGAWCTVAALAVDAAQRACAAAWLACTACAAGDAACATTVLVAGGGRACTRLRRREACMAVYVDAWRCVLTSPLLSEIFENVASRPGSTEHTRQGGHHAIGPRCQCSLTLSGSWLILLCSGLISTLDLCHIPKARIGPVLSSRHLLS